METSFGYGPDALQTAHLKKIFFPPAATSGLFLSGFSLAAAFSIEFPLNDRAEQF
jgi:hypothetical protein